MSEEFTSEEKAKVLTMFCNDIVSKLDDVQYKLNQIKDMGLLDDLLDSGFGMTVHVRAFDKTIAECVLGRGPAVQKCVLGLMLRIGLLTKGDEHGED